MNRYCTSMLRTFAVGIVLACMAGSAIGQSSSDTLEKGFQQPPDAARPLVWWHWMNGNISKEGIKLDLEWMHRTGLKGFQNFDAALATPQVVDHRLAYMTPEWKDAFKYATTLADQLGMEEAIAASPGWSETGGPWVPGSEGMKKYVWSETLVEGGKPFSGKLTHPPSNTGGFQNLGVRDLLAAPEGAPPPPTFYADAAVVSRLSQTGQRCARGLSSSQDDGERGCSRCGVAQRRRFAKHNQASDSESRRECLDPI
jgi:hypothetical protein